MSAGGGVPPNEPLVMFGRVSDASPLSWAWVAAQLDEAPTYWIVPATEGHPHPRPVWGIWRDGSLYLSVGSPVIRRELVRSPRVTVHLNSGTDVVIVEGVVAGSRDDDDAVRQYDEKYDWSYSVSDYGPLTEVVAVTVLAWRASGWAGRDGFQETGRWRLRQT